MGESDVTPGDEGGGARAGPRGGAGGRPRAAGQVSRPGRRDVLKGGLATAGALTAVFGTLAQACGSDPGVEVVVPWSGREREVFGRIVALYDRPVNVETGGDDIDSFVQGQQRTGKIPDVVILPRPGLVRRYARDGWLEPMEDRIHERFGSAWNGLTTAQEESGDATPYGAWVKAAHKSVFWYRPSLTGGNRPKSTWTWTDFREWVAERAASPGPPPLAVGAADGWVLTDWFENLLAGHADQDLYEALACGQPCWEEPAVRAAFLDLASVWGIDGAVLGGRDARVMEFEEAVRHVIEGRAVATVEGDFVDSVIDSLGLDDPGWDRPEAEFFPAANSRRPLVVGGDIAVVRKGSEEGKRLVEWLTDYEALEAWMAEPGYLTPNTKASELRYGRDLQTYLGAHLLQAGPEDLRFDLSDQLPAPLTGADGQGSWQFLTTFFTDVVSGRVTSDEAVEAVVRRFTEAARGLPPGGSCG